MSGTLGRQVISRPDDASRIGRETSPIIALVGPIDQIVYLFYFFFTTWTFKNIN